MELPQISTALSAPVQHIICEVGTAADRIDPDALTDGKILNLNHLCKVLPQEVDDSAEYFISCCQCLSPVFAAVCSELRSWSTEEYQHYYQQNMMWTHQAETLEECFKMCMEGGSALNHSLLISTSILERSLGDVFLLRGSQCPSMLKDLLVTPEIKYFFGKTAVQLLRILIGPPVSLNLRNVVWHGFPQPGEIPIQYNYMILCVLASLGSLLENTKLKTSDIPQREFVEFPQIVKLEGIYPGKLKKECYKKIEKLFEESTFVQTSMLPSWRRAIYMSLNNCHGDSVCLILPQLEYALRRVFVTVNECPDRVLTAESSEFFTTLDQMLARQLPDGKENKLYGTLTHPIMICDMCFALDSWNNLQKPTDVSENENVFTESEVESCIVEASCYLIRLCAAPSSWTGYAEAEESLVELEQSVSDIKVNTVSSIPAIPESSMANDQQADNVSDGRNAEITSLLRRIMQESLCVSNQVQEGADAWYTKWKGKQLRSRQRKTYQRLLQSINCLSCGLRLVIIIVITQFMMLSEIENLPSHAKSVRFLKHVLQCTENLRTNTSVEKNRWEEAVVLLRQLSQRTITFKL